MKEKLELILRDENSKITSKILVQEVQKTSYKFDIENLCYTQMWVIAEDEKYGEIMSIRNNRVYGDTEVDLYSKKENFIYSFHFNKGNLTQIKLSQELIPISYKRDDDNIIDAYKYVLNVLKERVIDNKNFNEEFLKNLNRIKNINFEESLEDMNFNAKEFARHNTRVDSGSELNINEYKN